MLDFKEIAYENAVLIGVITREQPLEKIEEYLDELELLTFTAGGQVIKRFVQKINLPKRKTLIGTGKIEEIRSFVEENEVSTVIFDDELSPAQQNNVEK